MLALSNDKSNDRNKMCKLIQQAFHASRLSLQVEKLNNGTHLEIPWFMEPQDWSQVTQKAGNRYTEPTQSSSFYWYKVHFHLLSLPPKTVQHMHFSLLPLSNLWCTNVVVTGINHSKNIRVAVYTVTSLWIFIIIVTMFFTLLYEIRWNSVLWYNYL